jgi:hypothetical protein
MDHANSSGRDNIVAGAKGSRGLMHVQGDRRQNFSLSLSSLNTMRLRQVLRRLVQLPMFTTVAVLLLAIGIGANTAIFSVIEGILLKPLPYRRPDELVAVEHAAPGVNLPKARSVALSSIVPMADQGWRDQVFAEHHVYAESQIPHIRAFKFISPGLPATMGNSIVAGRDLTWTDIYETRAVAMVSENLARELWGQPSAAIGKRVREHLKAPWREVVGVVGDERTDGVNEKAPTIVLWPLLMDHFSSNETFVQRSAVYVIRSTRTGSTGFLNEISQAVWSVNPNLPLANVRTLQEIYDASLARTTFTLVMLAIAGAMALLLGVTGIYGVISYSVTQRTREIGIRIAVGAQHQEVTRMFVGQGLKLAGAGIACGFVAAFALMRLMA